MQIRKKLSSKTVGVISLLALFVTHSASADIMAYPKKGQSEKQQATDKAKCSQWATQKTGIDPTALLEEIQQAPSQQTPRGGAVRGAAKGAAAGAVGGAIGGDTGEGAAIGAGVGAVGGAGRQHRQKREMAEAQEQAKSQIQQQLNTFEKAEKACLEGKGYSVS
jgi:hypothetical protein